MSRDHHPPPSLALVMSVWDEEEFLEANLTYHHALEVSRAYVFLDRCTDASPEIGRSFPWVRAIERDRRPEEAYMSGYQLHCLTAALEMTRAEGYEWLMHMDANEFACGDGRPAWLHLARRLLRLRSALLPKHAPFWRLHYYQLRGILNRSMLDSSTSEIRHLEDRIGHWYGTSIVRTSAGGRPVSIRRWCSTPEGVILPTEERGFHYHFTVVDDAHWLKKHR
ncbi:MAG: glycosyltransferase family 2 protein, partial [Chloroflexota bacterium]|nr:glycosyltransferase family 2 protein [Chloroflexota bacterium]